MINKRISDFSSLQKECKEWGGEQIREKNIGGTLAGENKKTFRYSSWVCIRMGEGGGALVCGSF